MNCGVIAVILAVSLGVSFLVALYLAFDVAGRSGRGVINFDGAVPHLDERVKHDDPTHAEELAFERSLALQKEMRGSEDPFREMY